MTTSLSSQGKTSAVSTQKSALLVLLFFARDKCYYRIFLQNFIGGALMLVRNVKLKVSWRMFWLHGFMWLILIKAVILLKPLNHHSSPSFSLCLVSALIQHVFFSLLSTVFLLMCLSFCLLASAAVSLPVFFTSCPSLCFILFILLFLLSGCLSSTYRHRIE